MTALPNFCNSRHGKSVVSRRVQLLGFALICVLLNHACKFVPHFQHYFPRHILVFAHKNLRVASQRRRGIAKSRPLLTSPLKGRNFSATSLLLCKNLETSGMFLHKHEDVRPKRALRVLRITATCSCRPAKARFSLRLKCLHVQLNKGRIIYSGIN